MAPKRSLEDEASAVGGVKKLRLEARHDDDDRMYDAQPELDVPEDTDNVLAPGDTEGEEVHETETPQIVLDNLDYENGGFLDELAYDENGKFHPGYHNPTTAIYTMPKTTESAVATPAVALPLPELSPDKLHERIRNALLKFSKYAALPEVKLDKLSERIGKALLKFPESAIPLVLASTRKKDELVNLFQNIKSLDGGWIGVEGRLGKGGQGCARLFVKVDDQNRITERIVVKDSFQKLEMWADEHWWERGRLGMDPRESIVNKLLSLPTPERWERYIVEYLGHSINHKWKTNRTYMEYCDGGDLHKLMKAQNQRYSHPNPNYDPDSGSREDFEDNNNPKSIEVSGGKVIPEPFAWYYLKQMAVALHRMSNIPIRQNKGDFVVHKDIKPENIFLTSPDPREFPRYPICKVGDFGSAHVTFPTDPDNPEQWYDHTTPGYIPPEMDEFVYSTIGWELSTATNRPDEINYEDDDLNLGAKSMHSLDDLEQDYSIELRDLLEEMLYIDPKNRPSPQDIIEWFYKNKDKWEGMATAPSCDDFDLYPSWLHWSPSEEFQINDFFEKAPSSSRKEKKTKKKIGGLPVPGSSDEDSSDDDEDDEHKGPLKGKKGGVDDHDHNILHASGVYPGDEEYEDEYGEEEEEEDEEDEGEEGGEEEEEEEFDEDDPMAGSSGPSLTSGSEFILPSEDEDILMRGVSKGSGSF
ncbi:kinase-like protein, partial [Aureobasidium melanogenum]